ncbi:MAG: serine/threonine protein kinase [Burkholderiales bacterium]|nr:serine/threonine protein kinase [Burkholderiales bacterium]
MAQEYVRVCPVCDVENPPERARCACGALLAGVDFSLKRAPAPPSAEAPAGASAEPPAQAATLTCPHADCGQANPAGSVRCVYCNRPLRAAPEVTGARPLPSALRDRYRVVDVFPATGSEADILLVVDERKGDRAVAKLYRKGIQPDFHLLDILARSVGDTVVKVLDHGVSDGAAYELLEYVPGGTLEALLRAGPLPKADIRRIVAEIADALVGIHAHGILHRDLKPENVLVRGARPLSLALTDFGIASMSAATQHFTTAARTTKYAAPEVLTGVLDRKADFWSLGMIALEAATGRHPFDGLNEQVMNHQLATRPIDVRAVYDDELRTLCRGLLLRDPKRRWGSEEVARWLAGDATLTAAEDAEATAPFGVRPYRFDRTEATTAAELAQALAKHWEAARRDLARGQVARWLENELHDYNLLRTLRDLQEQRDLTEDARLLRFLLAAAPDLPPVWRGTPVAVETLNNSARDAAKGDDDARDWLDSLWRDGVLASFGDAGSASLRDLDRRWREGWQAFTQLWAGAQREEEEWSRKPRGDGVVSYDDLVYAAPDRLAPPAQRFVNGPLILALSDAAFVDALRGEVLAGLGQVAGFCPWYESAWERAQQSPAGVVMARLMLPLAQDAAKQEQRRQAATAEARARSQDAARAALRERVSQILALSPSGERDLEAQSVTALLDCFDELQAACRNIERLGHVDADYEDLRRSAEKLATLGRSAQRALIQAEEVQGANAIFATPGRIAFAAGILGVALLTRLPVVFLAILGVALAAIGYRWYTGFRATEGALAKLKLFGLHGRTFLRSTDPPAE